MIGSFHRSMEVGYSSDVVEKPVEPVKKVEVPTLAIPVLVQPANNAIFTEESFDASDPKIQFAWKEVKDATWYRFTLYQGADMKDKLAAYKVKGTNFSLSGNKMALLDNGDLVWTIEAVTEKDGKRYYGKPAAYSFKLNISDLDEVSIDKSDLLNAK